VVETHKLRSWCPLAKPVNVNSSFFQLEQSLTWLETRKSFLFQALRDTSQISTISEERRGRKQARDSVPKNMTMRERNERDTEKLVVDRDLHDNRDAASFHTTQMIMKGKNRKENMTVVSGFHNVPKTRRKNSGRILRSTRPMQ
jgi:hypothetical protein